VRWQGFGRHAVFAHGSSREVDAVGSRVRSRGDDPVDFMVDEVYRGAVIDGKAWGDIP